MLNLFKNPNIIGKSSFFNSVVVHENFIDGTSISISTNHDSLNEFEKKYMITSKKISISDRTEVGKILYCVKKCEHLLMRNIHTSNELIFLTNLTNIITKLEIEQRVINPKNITPDTILSYNLSYLPQLQILCINSPTKIKNINLQNKLEELILSNYH